jgi:hypothetical protein
MQGVVMLNVIFHYCYDKCHYTECHLAECRGTLATAIRA